MSINERENVAEHCKSINKLKRQLSHEEEFRLAKLIERGDKSALQDLVQCNFALAVYCATNFYKNPGRRLSPTVRFSYMECVQEANIGLLKAAESFDPRYGVRFGSYATWIIGFHLMRSSYKQGYFVHLPNPKQGNAQTENEVDFSDIADPLNEGDKWDFDSYEVPDYSVVSGITRDRMMEALDTAVDSLAENERLVFCWSHGYAGHERLSVTQIRDKLHVSFRMVRRYKKIAQSKIKHALISQGIDRSSLDVFGN